MTTIRPAPVTILIFVAIGLIISLPGIDAIRLGEWPGLAFILVGFAIGAAPMSRFIISWDTDSLTYRGLISTRKIQFSEVREFHVHGPAFGDKFGPTLGLSIFSVSSDTPVMTINIKPFSRQDIARLTERLKQTTG
jgi:hypothetical protein